MVINEYDVSQLEKHSELSFIGRYVFDTGEIIPNKKAKYHNLEFIIHDSNLLVIQGSLHKYKNDGYYNYDDFSYSQIVKVLNELSMKFNFSLNKSVLRNFEVGVNIVPAKSSKDVLCDLLAHKNRKFKDVSRTGGNIRQAEYQQYRLKVYDKGQQNNLVNQILRVELSFNRMQKMNDIGLYTLADLLNKELYYKLGGLLRKEWRNVLLYERAEQPNKIPLNIKRKKQHQWRDSEYWDSLPKQERLRQKKRYLQFVSNYTNNTHGELESLIDNKFKSLIEK